MYGVIWPKGVPIVVENVSSPLEEGFPSFAYSESAFL